MHGQLADRGHHLACDVLRQANGATKDSGGSCFYEFVGFRCCSVVDY